ncbi:glycosyltransferase [Aeromonas veronii]
MMPYTAVATIVFYKNSSEQVVNVVSACAKLSNTTVLIIDNSPDESINKYLSELIEPDIKKKVKYVHTPSNPGFGASHNLAIKYFPNVDYYFIVNPDVYFEYNVNTMIDYIESQPDIGCLVPKVVYPNGRLQKLCKLLPSPMDLFLRRFIPALSFITDKKLMLLGYDYTFLLDIPYASGCFMLIRGDIFRNIGGFDERFFMYLEDTDLSRRIARISRVVFYPDVCIVHEFSKASYKNKKIMAIHIISALKYFNKWGWFLDKERNSMNKKTLDMIMQFETKEG